MRLPRITDWMTWILGWQSQNNWIIWGYTEAESKKNQLELCGHVCASKDYGSSDLNREEKVRASVFFFLYCHFILLCGLLHFCVSISKSLNRNCQLVHNTNALRWCSAFCWSSFAIDLRGWWFSCKKSWHYYCCETKGSLSFPVVTFQSIYFCSTGLPYEACTFWN